MSQVKQVYRKYNVNSSDPSIIELRDILGKRMGYFSKVAQWVFEDDVPLCEIRNIINSLDNIRISKPINDFHDIEELSNYIRDIHNKRKLNQVIKSIPSNSRRNVSSRVRNLIYTNIDKEEVIKDFLSKKGGSCKTEDELYQRISEVINLSSGDTSYKGILRRIKLKLFILNIPNLLINLLTMRWVGGLLKGGFSIDNKHGKIVYKDGKNIILRVGTYRLSSLLGSPHWCISTNKYHWDMYVPKSGDNIQYFIFQTEYVDKRSMIGVTVEPGGNKKATHYRNDSICYGQELSKYRRYLKGTELIIYTASDILKHRNKDLNLILSTPDWCSVFLLPKSPSIRDITEDICINKHKYSYDDYCKFVYTLVRRNYIPLSREILSHFSEVDYRDPYFKDDQSACERLVLYKIYNYMCHRIPLYLGPMPLYLGPLDISLDECDLSKIGEMVSRCPSALIKWDKMTRLGKTKTIEGILNNFSMTQINIY